MSDNQTQYSKEFLQQVKELKKEIEEILNDESIVWEDKQNLANFLKALSILNTKTNKNREKLYQLYPEFQMYLAICYEEQGKLEKAEIGYKNIKVQYGEEQYARAQLNLGLIYDKQGKLDMAEKCWHNIREEYSKKWYAQAQFNLGVSYYEQKELDKAKTYYQNIKEQYCKIIYAQAQLNLGALYYEQGDIELAKQHWLNIQEKHDLKQYTNAQFNLGILYDKQGDIEQAKQYYQNIQEKNDLEAYAKAQFNFGFLYEKQGDIKHAKQHWQNIQEKHGLKIYAMAQFCLVIIYAKEKNETEFKQCIIELKKYYHQNDEYIQHVIDNVQNTRILLKNKGILLEILDHYLDIRNALQVVQIDKPINSPERAFAHYTEVGTAINFFQKENSWDFRISSAQQFNDPTEGNVLFQFLNNYSNQLKLQEINKEKSSELAVFIGCFTFNHDSLNQFRLYGKKQNREATGVSLVLNPSFFSNSHTGIMSFGITEQIKIDTSINNNMKITTIKSTATKAINRQEKNNAECNTLPLYRCIYLDPESFMKNEKGEKMPYLKIAARDELTFYRENDKNIQDFKDYQDYIDDIQREVNKQFNEMIIKIEQLFENIEENEIKKEILNILNLILLPFSYLVKHSAYHEEQECRILYCCPFNDHAVIEENFDGDYSSAKLYRKYRAINKDDIARIYLSEGAKGYANVFKRLGIKDVRMSSNPFRTAEKE